MLLAFALFYIFTIWSTGISAIRQHKLLIATCVIFTFVIGLRNPAIWDDTGVYVYSFQHSPDIFHFLEGKPYGFAEYGIYLVGCLLKLFTSSYELYLTVIAGIAMYLLYKSLDKFCVFPLLGFCDYLARYMMNRDFMQIRSSICILIIICALPLVKNRKFLKFMLVVWGAYFVHHMSLIAIPFYFLYNVKFKRYQIALLLIGAFAFAAFGSGYISDWAVANSGDLDYSTYVTDEYRNESVEQGLRNPLIYIQLFIFVLFLLMENSLKRYPYYILFKNGYLYATIILIIFSQYTALAQRTSAMFSTLECFMIPLMLLGIKKKYWNFYFFGLGIMLIVVFYLKFYVLYHSRNPDATILW